MLSGDRSQRIDRFISLRGGLSRGEARRLLDRGGVWVDGRRVKIASRGVDAGQQVTVVLEESGRTSFQAKPLQPEQILYEDGEIIAVDKPPGVPSQATMGSDQGTLLDIVSNYLGNSVWLVHRLDLETSGVVVFAKTRATASRLGEQFREGAIEKKYLAISCGKLADQATIDLPLGPDPKRRGRYIACESCLLPASTSYRVWGRYEEINAVELNPKTGRTHQLRAHLASQKAPIVGDILYGGRREWQTFRGLQKAARVLLHAHNLEICHPITRENLSITAPVPQDLSEWWELCANFDFFKK